MTQQTSPFLEGKFGWNQGESNWNLGMDENLLKFSYMFDRNIDGIVSSLPAVVNGTAYFLTTDNRLYYAVNGVYSSSPTPKWFEVTLRSTGIVYYFNGTTLVQLAQTTSADATAGRLMRVGAGGVLGPLPQINETNIRDADLPSGDYNVMATGAGFLPVNSNGYLKVSDILSANFARLEYTPVTSTRTYVTLNIAGVWQPWREMTSVRVDTISALRGLNKLVATEAFVQSYSTLGDLGGGQFYLDAADTTSADNGGTIIVATDGGRWKRSGQAVPTVAQFGGKGDGVTNNSPVINAMISAGIREIIYGAGSWFHATTIQLPQASNINFRGTGFRTTILTYSNAVAYTLFNYDRTTGQAGSVFTFSDMAFNWLGTAKQSGSIAIRSYGFSDVASDNWLRVYRCAFFNSQIGVRSKWTGQTYMVDNFYQNNTYSHFMERGCSFWYFRGCQSFDSTFIFAQDTVHDAFSNGLFIDSCHNITATAECMFVEGYQAVFIGKCGWDLGSGGAAALYFKNCQDVYVDSCFISSNISLTRQGVSFDATHTAAVTKCTIVNNSIGIQMTAPSALIGTKIVVDGNKFENNATNDVLLLNNVESVKIINNHHQKQMARTGSAFEIYGNVAGVNNCIVQFNTLVGAPYTITMGANSIIGNNIFNVKA